VNNYHEPALRHTFALANISDKYQMRNWINLITENTTLDLDEVTIERRDSDFLAIWNGNVVGQLSIDMTREHEGGYAASQAIVKAGFRKKGIGSRLYDAAEAWLNARGEKLVPSSPEELSDDGFEFWRKRDPESDIRFDPRFK
jgi:ribosomal protein S18 acetylase RimI-like enzyme